jgi:CDP-4-dehydro-6-deoxyglucose reductase
MPLILPRFEARLVRARALTRSVRELAFERVDGQPMTFAAGQFCNVLLPLQAGPGGETGGPQELKRSYSIASPPDGSPRFEIAVTRVQDGPGSTWIHSIEPGTVLPFTGPQGFFTRPPASARPSLMIATGTGVTPLRSMVLDAIAAGSQVPLWLVLGVRHEEDLLYEQEFRDLARAHAFVHFEPTLSQPRGAWEGKRGYVQTHVRDLWEALATGAEGAPHAYVCGLERMVASVRDLLRKQMGVPREQVHSERYD